MKDTRTYGNIVKHLTPLAENFLLSVCFNNFHATAMCILHCQTRLTFHWSSRAVTKLTYMSMTLLASLGAICTSFKQFTFPLAWLDC